MEQVCRVLEVSRSGYYGWLEGKLGVRSQKNQALRTDIFAYLEAFYNTVRPHSALGWLSPTRFEASLYPSAA